MNIYLGSSTVLARINHNVQKGESKRKEKKEKEKEGQGKKEKKKGGGDGKKSLRWDLNPGPSEYRTLVRRGKQWSVLVSSWLLPTTTSSSCGLSISWSKGEQH